MRVRELRVAYVPVHGTSAGRQQLKTPASLATFFRPWLEHEAVEVLMIALLDTKQQLIAVHTVGRGTLDATVVHPRDVFKAALLANAALLATAHNHPSGIVDPSPDDRALFQRLDASGAVVGIQVIDHLIIGHGGTYWSRKEREA